MTVKTGMASPKEHLGAAAPGAAGKAQSGRLMPVPLHTRTPARHRIGNFPAKLKVFRVIATRAGRTVESVLVFIDLVAGVIAVR